MGISIITFCLYLYQFYWVILIIIMTQHCVVIIICNRILSHCKHRRRGVS
jgi:hypothetical protein